MIVNINDVFGILKKRPPESNKGNFGTLNIIAGSTLYRGAASLNVLAALRSGCGIVRLCSTEKVIAAAAAKVCEAIFLPIAENPDTGGISSESIITLNGILTKGSACLAGCGMINSSDTAAIVKYLLKNLECPLVLDADALNSISSDTSVLLDTKAKVIVTPHIGEMSRLCSKSIHDILESPNDTALEFSKKYNCITVLKNNRTRIASPDGQLYINETGNPGLARGGSGDLLSGMIASFVSQGINPLEAALCGVYLHGLAADRCAARLSQYGMLPSDILEDLCGIFLDADR